jgi:hypothetical protein
MRYLSGIITILTTLPEQPASNFRRIYKYLS